MPEQTAQVFELCISITAHARKPLGLVFRGTLPSDLILILENFPAEMKEIFHGKFKLICSMSGTVIFPLISAQCRWTGGGAGRASASRNANPPGIVVIH